MFSKINKNFDLGVVNHIGGASNGQKVIKNYEL